MFTFLEMLALVESESSFGAYVCHGRPGGCTAPSDLVGVCVCAVFFLPNILCVHVRKLGTSVRKSTTKTDLQNLPNQFRSEQTSLSFQKKTDTRANLRSFLSSQTGVHL